MILLLMTLESETEREIISDLFAKNYHRLKRAATGILGRPDDAEDAVQETFARCIRHSGKLCDLPELARPLYLMTALKHTALNIRKQRAAHTTVPLEEIELADEHAAVEDQAIRSLTVGEIREAFKRLPESTRDVLRYKYLLELSDGEIANTLGVTKGTVRSYLTRARRAILEMCREKENA
jgi:RNA polymerase sigma-70 factor (ECF subfamily)